MELNREQIVYCLEQDIERGIGMNRTVDVTDIKRAISLIKELTEKNERLRDLVKEVQEYNENWVADNGRLRGILLQFTDIVHKWGNKNGYDTSEISLVPILNEETAIKSQIVANTVRRMQERLKELAYTSSDWSHGEHPKVVEIDDIDQIAKEMLEGENEN